MRPVSLTLCRIRDGEETHVDEIMCGVQGASKKAAIVGFGPLPVRMGVAECRSGLRKTYRVPRANKEVCLRVNAASRPEEELAKHRRVTG